MPTDETSFHNFGVFWVPLHNLHNFGVFLGSFTQFARFWCFLGFFISGGDSSPSLALADQTLTKESFDSKFFFKFCIEWRFLNNNKNWNNV